ncbi:hypothetical protein U1Q18_027950 [Sarracenia purpurea var. burkii]
MAIVEARIRKLKGLSPVKVQAVVGAEVSEVPPLGKGGTIVPSLPLAMAIPESTEGGSIEPNVREVSTGEDVVYSVEEISDKDNSERLSDEAVDKAHGVCEASGKENKRFQVVEVVRKCDDFVPHPVSPGGGDELCRPCMGNAAEDKTDGASMQPHETKSRADIGEQQEKKHDRAFTVKRFYQPITRAVSRVSSQGSRLPMTHKPVAAQPA